MCWWSLPLVSLSKGLKHPYSFAHHSPRKGSTLHLLRWNPSLSFADLGLFQCADGLFLEWAATVLELKVRVLLFSLLLLCQLHRLHETLKSTTFLPDFSCSPLLFECSPFFIWTLDPGLTLGHLSSNFVLFLPFHCELQNAANICFCNNKREPTGNRRGLPEADGNMGFLISFFYTLYFLNKEGIFKFKKETVEGKREICIIPYTTLS